MSKNEPSGLLSKVVSFVRRPGAGWNDVEGSETDRDSGYNKQMLKEMIERKRRNDFVRRREFDQLRKLRKRESAASGEEGNGRQSFFQSSMPSRPDDRAITLKKIDEIEAQMSMQWWKTKQGAESTQPAHSLHPAQDGSVIPPAPRASGYGSMAKVSGLSGLSTDQAALIPTLEPIDSEPTTPMLPPEFDNIPVLTEPVAELSLSLEPQSAEAEPEAEESISKPVYLSTVPAEIGPPVLEDVVFPELEGVDEELRLSDSDAPYLVEAASHPYAAPAAFTPPTIMAPPVIQPFVHRPELEEAAIRFANGDHAGAEAGLLELLGPGAPFSEEADVWMTLLDLYRATGQHDRFDGVAIDFAVRFGRSAPLWFSLPEMLGLPSEPVSGQTVPGRAFQWMAPVALAGTSVLALQASLARTPAPWTLNWKMLNSMDAAAAKLLADQFARLAEMPVQLNFLAAPNLDRVLREQTVPDDSAVDVQWWRLRMETLRLRGQMEEFEAVALDYCITYEVSPPSWVEVRCDYVEVRDATPGVLADDAPGDSLPAIDAASEPMGLYGQSSPAPLEPVVELAGHIVGDAESALRALEGTHQPGQQLVVSCDRLARVDFSAAGSVLNWAADRQAEGCHVQFLRMPRLVAVFFNVVGINEHATIVPRKD